MPYDLNSSSPAAIQHVFSSLIYVPPNAFHNDTLAVQAVVLDNIGHLLPEVVPSSVGAMYLRFATWEDRR